MNLRFAAALAFVPFALLVPRTASADILSSCGNIDVKANATCKVYVDADCNAQCTPVSVTAACQAKGQISCDGSCTADVDVSCSGSCEAECNGSCTADPGSIDCNANCTGSCNADCSTQCSAEASGSQASADCKAHCEGNCSAKCSGSCKGTPPTVDCNTKCHASCQGSCKGKATASCEVDCQGKLQAKCEVDVQGGCKVRCSDPKGALFCDGQFVDTGDNLQKCIDDLYAALNIKVDATASGSCTGNECSGEAAAKVSACSTTAPDVGTASLAPAFLAIGALGIMIARRKRAA